MYKIRKTQILGFTMFVMLIAGGNLYAKITPDCEIGDALFGKIHLGGITEPSWARRIGHAGIYYCSSTRKGNEAWNPDTDLVNSNMEFGVIKAVSTPEEKLKVQICKITSSFDDKYFLRAYNKIQNVKL